MTDQLKFALRQIDRSNSAPVNRRTFLANTAVAGGSLAVGYHANSARAAESKSTLDRLNIAAVGTANQAGSNLKNMSTENIMALSDVDQEFLDQAGAEYPQARKYRDWRVMLEKEEKNIDAVMVGTPDHTHAPAAAMAMRMNKHVFCEKPLTHTVYESRVLADLARQNNLITQLGTNIHAGDNYRRVVELIQSGSIGEVRETHVWVNVDYSGRHLITGTPAPSHVDWDLWLGPTATRPYCESADRNGGVIPLHPRNWRYIWDYGTGGLGDFGCHYMDLVHWALKLKYPNKVSATGPTPRQIGCTAGLVVNYEYPARGSLPPVTLTWHDGGKQPAVLSTLKNSDGSPLSWPNGQLFIGSEGMVISNYHRHMLLPVDRFSDFQRPEPFIPKSIGHHQEWVHAVKSGSPATCDFGYSGPLTEAVLLGVVSYRSGQTIEWDATNLKVKNAPHAQQYIHKEYRQGWTL